MSESLALAPQGTDAALRPKLLQMHIYKRDRQIGVFDNNMHSDIRHCFDMLRRGRPITIGPERIAQGTIICLSASEFDVQRRRYRWFCEQKLNKVSYRIAICKT